MSHFPDGGADASAPVILVVDDARINRELLRINLSRHGYQVLTATNGQEAILTLEGGQPVDLIMLDLVMPQMDGFDFLRWREERPEMGAVPVIVNSSLDDFNSIAQALTMGSYDYFTKPLSAQDLDTVLPLKIKNAVTARRLMAETRRQNEAFKRELEMAARYQTFLLPQGAYFKGVELAFSFQPCSGVGGDYFDFLELPGPRLGLVVADVAGHGVASAMTASIIKALLPGYLERHLSPAKAFMDLNQDLMRLTPSDVFVTAFAALYDPLRRRLEWCSAGHPPALAWSGGDEVELLTMESPFLGAFDRDSPLMDLRDMGLKVKEGLRLAFYTDGLTEAPDAQGNQYGLDRLRRHLDRHRGLGLEELRASLWDDLKAHVGSDFPDDVALILVEFQNG